MRLKNILMVSLMALMAITLCLRPAQAVKDNSQNPETRDQINNDMPEKDRDEKGSLWSAVRTLANIDEYHSRGVITDVEYDDYVTNGRMSRATFDKLRKGAGDWSQTTGDREIRELKDSGFIRENQVDGMYVFNLQPTKDDITRVQSNDELVVVMDRGSGVQQLAADEVASIKNAFGMGMETGDYAFAGDDSRLTALSMEQVIPTTDTVVSSSQAERDYLLDMVGKGYTVAIATRSRSKAHINAVIDAFGDRDRIVDLIDRDKILFSHVPNSSVFDIIQQRAGEGLSERTADKYDRSVMENLGSGV